MKTGISLIELATELERQAASKKDFIAHTTKLSFEVDANAIEVVNDADEAEANTDIHTVNRIVLNGLPIGSAPVRKTAHDQFAATLDIPRRYYNRMRHEAPDLLVTNLNRWLEKPSVRMIRTMDNEVRALVSDSYRPLDNLDLMLAVMPRFQELGLEVVSSTITDEHLYLQARTERLQGEVLVGDIVQQGIIISNSEVGRGRLTMEDMLFRLACLNGMVTKLPNASRGIIKNHAGGKNGNNGVGDYVSSRTRQLEDGAFWSSVQDAASQMLDPKAIEQHIDRFKNAATTEIERPAEVVEVLSTRFSLSEKEKAQALHLMLTDGLGNTRWGLANAMTGLAHTARSPERMVELERIGGRVIELPANSWSAVVKEAERIVEDRERELVGA